jgi:hypothetical protein
MSKILKITDGNEVLDIECVDQIHSLVSETILQKFKDCENVISQEVVLEVLLMISGITGKECKNWRFLNNIVVSEQTT